MVISATEWGRNKVHSRQPVHCYVDAKTSAGATRQGQSTCQSGLPMRTSKTSLVAALVATACGSSSSASLRTPDASADTSMPGDAAGIDAEVDSPADAHGKHPQMRPRRHAPTALSAPGRRSRPCPWPARSASQSSPRTARSGRGSGRSRRRARELVHEHVDYLYVTAGGFDAGGLDTAYSARVRF
jgi:hypothetical protein